MMSALPDLNAAVSERVMVNTAAEVWEPSPSGTVWRKPLYRRGGEFGPVTSIVRYAPGGTFRAHPHPEGEEILVLDGVFSDDSGDFPAGSWLFNPEGFSHAPRSEPGCDLFVRLRQYPGRRCRRLVDTETAPWLDGAVPGLSLMPLYSEPDFPEFVCFLRLAPDTRLPEQRFPDGVEYLMLDGLLCDEAGEYAAGTWLRLPPGGAHTPRAVLGCTAYLRLPTPSRTVYESSPKEEGKA